MSQLELGQGDDAHLLLGNQLLGGDELLVRDAEGRHVGLAGGLELLDQDQHVEFGGLDADQVAQRHLGDLFVVSAEVFAEKGGEAVAAAPNHLGGDRPGRVVGVGEHRRLVVGDDAPDRFLDRAAVNRDEDRVVPRLADLGEGVLHRTDVGNELQLLLRQVAQQGAADAEEQRIARGENDRVLVALLQPLDDGADIPADHDLLSGKLGEKVQLPLAAHQQFGLADQVERSLAESLLSFHSCTDDMNRLHRPSFSAGRAGCGP